MIIKKILACTMAATLVASAQPQPSTMYAAKQSSQLVVSPKNVTLIAGKTKNITANQNVTWKSSNTKIAKVSSISKKKAKIMAVKEGKCTITVKSKNKTKKIKVTVTPKMSVSQKNLTLEEGNAKTITTNKNSTWKSSDAQIAEVSLINKKKAEITAKKEGKCTITVKSGSETIKIKVTVTKAVEPSKEPKPTVTVEPSKEPEPTMTVEPSKEPEPTITVEPSKGPEPTMTTEPSKEPEPTMTTEPSKEPEPTMTTEPSKEPEPTNTVEPSKEPEPTMTTEPSKEPEPTMTTEPSKEPEPTMTVEPSKEPEPTNTVEPSKEPQVATMAAVISKVEGDSIWIENGANELHLSENVTILKNAKYDGKERLEITAYELFEGDEITITYSAIGAEGYTSDTLRCEKIVVENSKIRLLKEDKIAQIQNGRGMFLEDYNGPLWYHYGNDPEGTGSDRATKIIKNGKEISFDELKEGDSIRVSYRRQGEVPGAAGFTDFLETVIVLSE